MEYIEKKNVLKLLSNNAVIDIVTHACLKNIHISRMIC